VDLKKATVMAVIIAAIAVTAYLPKLANEFAYDDHAFVLGEPSHTDLKNIPSFFGTDQHRLYRPLRSVLYTVVHHFGGFSPRAYHAVGIALHALVTTLFFATLLLLFGRPRLAFFAALIAAVHPLHVARVANITGSFDLFGMALAFAAMPVFLLYLKKGGVVRLSASILLLAAGLLGSEEAATIPLLLLLFFLAPQPDDQSRRRFLTGWPLMVGATVLYAVVRSVLVPGFSRVETYTAGGLAETIWTMAVVFWRYLGLAIAPIKLAAEHAVTVYQEPAMIPLLALIGMILLAAGAFGFRKKQPVLFVAIGWFFIGLAPFSNLIPLQTLFAEHYFYSGLLGFSLAVALLLDFLWARQSGRFWIRAAIVGVFVACCVLTVARIGIWKNDRTLWSDSLSKEPDTYMANANYAALLLKEARPEAAMPFLERAIKLEPEKGGPYKSMSKAYFLMGEREKADRYLRTARNLYARDAAEFPDKPIKLERVIELDLQLQEYERAFSQAMRLNSSDPNNTTALNAIGYVYAANGQCEKAIPYFQAILTQENAGTDLVEATKENLRRCEESTSNSPVVN
jgi:protein O-mannosyl-transferase